MGSGREIALKCKNFVLREWVQETLKLLEMEI